MIGTDKLRAFSATFLAIFMEKFMAGDLSWQQLCRMTSIKGMEGKYPFSTTAGKLREFDGEVSYRQLMMDMISIPDVTYTDGLQIPVNVIEDDNIGLVQGDISDLGMEGSQFAEILVAETLTAGWSTLGYDGVTFFGATHPRDNGLTDQSNTLGAVALNATNFNLGRVALAGFTDRAGNRRRFKASHLIHGPEIGPAVETLLDAQILASGATNTNYQKVVPIELAGITDKAWYVADLRWASRKPVIFQERSPAEVTPPGVGSDMLRTKQLAEYIVKMRVAAKLADPLTIVGSTGA